MNINHFLDLLKFILLNEVIYFPMRWLHLIHVDDDFWKYCNFNILKAFPLSVIKRLYHLVDFKEDLLTMISGISHFYSDVYF